METRSTHTAPTIAALTIYAQIQPAPQAIITVFTIPLGPTITTQTLLRKQIRTRALRLTEEIQASLCRMQQALALTQADFQSPILPARCLCIIYTQAQTAPPPQALF